MTDTERSFIRHVIATVAYRGGKAIRNAPETLADFRAGNAAKSPLGILSHMGDLDDWALSQMNGGVVWNDSETLSWNDEAERFFDSLKAFDKYLSSESKIDTSPE